MKEVISLHPAYGISPLKAKPSVRKMILPRTNKEGLTKVIIEVLWYDNLENKSTFRRIATDVWIKPKSWNKRKQEVQNDSESELKNTNIDKAFVAVKTYINSKGVQTANNPYVDQLNLNKLREFFPSDREAKKSLSDYVDDYITHRKGQRTPHGTLKEFTTMKNRLIAFDLYRGKKTYFDDISIVWSDEFERFLRNAAANRKIIGYGDGTIEKTYTILITVLNHFYKRRKTYQINNLTDDFKITGNDGFKRGSKSINDANPLTEDQLNTLSQHQFAERHLQITRDRFLWQCYTGIRYGDAFKITNANIKNDWLYYSPHKTLNYNVKVEQPLNSNASELLKKYDFDMTKMKITNQAYNRELIAIFTIMQDKHPKLNFKNDYGSHCGRDTFITMCVQKGVDWKTILKWVGQSSYRIMDRYIKVTDQYQQEQMNKLNTVPSEK